MTIQSSTTRTSYACDGVTTVFPVPIQAYQPGDFLVILTPPASVAGGVPINLVLGSNYALATSGSLSPTQWSLTSQTGGGINSPFPAGYSLQIILNPAVTQPSQYVQGQQFPSAAIQQNFDRLTQMILRLLDLDARRIFAPDGDVNPGMQLPIAALRANRSLAFDANGNVIAAALTIAPGLTGATATVGSLAALRLTSPTTGAPIYAVVLGAAAPGDGGGGIYYYNAGDVASADNGGTIIVSGDGGRWYLNNSWR